MGFEYEDVKLVLWALKPRQQRRELLILGDAIFHVDAQTYASLAKQMGFLLASAPAKLDPFTFGDSLGFDKTHTLDVNGRASLNVNLHDPAPDDLVGRFDCLIDAGVLFWCFDPAAAFKSILSMVKPGGLIVHISAVSGHYGRGYYNIHPLAFEDFYIGNGCQFVGASFRTKFRTWSLLDRALRKLGLGNHVAYCLEPGSAYLRDSTFNRISFSDHFRQPFERNILPNNVVGVMIYRKVSPGPIALPVRTTLYGPAEAQARRAQAVRSTPPRG